MSLVEEKAFRSLLAERLSVTIFHLADSFALGIQIGDPGNDKDWIIGLKTVRGRERNFRTIQGAWKFLCEDPNYERLFIKLIPMGGKHR